MTVPAYPAKRTVEQDPEAAEAYCLQRGTCDHGWLLWQSCRECNVGPLDVEDLRPDGTPLAVQRPSR